MTTIYQYFTDKLGAAPADDTLRQLPINSNTSDHPSKSADVSCCAGFRMPGCRDHPSARTAGVRKAPRHEIAGCGAPTVQRALWGFGVGVSGGEVEPTLAIGSL
jgi:hypothetical protein